MESQIENGLLTMKVEKLRKKLNIKMERKSKIRSRKKLIMMKKLKKIKKILEKKKLLSIIMRMEK
jgi:hypothetical protein